MIPADHPIEMGACGSEPSLSAHLHGSRTRLQAPIAADDEPRMRIPPRARMRRAAGETEHMNEPIALTRPASRRRHHRRSRAQAGGRLYCRTNGCASFLDIDEQRGIASCHICGYTRRIARPN